MTDSPLRIAIIPALGIGDALILHIFSYHLKQQGHQVTTFSGHLASFGTWLSGYTFQPLPPLDKLVSVLQSFDLIVLQHDNSPHSFLIQTLPQTLYTFYSNYKPVKHPPIRPGFDFIANPSLSMVANIDMAMQYFFHLSGKNMGLCPPPQCIHKKYPKRIVIHPLSSNPEKNWSRRQFLKLETQLKQTGFHPCFVVSPEERKTWPESINPLSLEHLASFLYESGGFIGNDSGTGHLASYLHIPSLIIGSSLSHLTLWQPGWRPAFLATPPAWLPNWTYFKRHWTQFVTNKKVFKLFTNNVIKN